MLVSFVTVLCSTTVVLASKPASWTREWEKLSVAPTEAPLTLSVALQSSGLEDIKRTLRSAHPQQQPLSHDEVLKHLTPTANTTGTFEGWLSAHHVDIKSLTWSKSNDWVSWNTTVGTASFLLDTTFYTFRHRIRKTEVIRAPDYHIPTDLAKHIKMVHPTKMFPTFPSDTTAYPVTSPGAINGTTSRRDTLQALCGNGAASIPCLKQLYNVKYEIGDFSAPANSYGVVGFNGDYANIEDLRTFMGTNLPDYLEAKFTAFRTYTVNGGIPPIVPNLKVDGVDLGIQYGAALAYPVPATFHLVGGSGPNGSPPLLEWVQWAKSALSLSSAIVIPYVELEENITSDYAHAVCDGLAALAARGVSVIVPSGDHGSAACAGTSAATSKSVFPASCPYVTVVGGTGFDSSSATEHPVDFSGGGYSTYFDSPSYQTKASGRAYPDVAALATSYAPVVGGTAKTVSSTIGSATAFAAMIALINDRLIERGKKPLGFLNPWIYGAAKGAFNDVTSGASVGCASAKGYTASTGWDAVTGLGTPDWEKLATIAGV